ncbi:hypothetical protein ACFXPY_40720 [Streptomyces sp. NPDC059153]
MRKTAVIRRTEWLRVHRDMWGFVGLVLRRTSDRLRTSPGAPARPD